MKAPSGTIAMFYGLPATIPPGWKSCDGTLGTPDLRDRFVRGAGLFHPVGATGGSAVHNHSFTTDGHYHRISVGIDFAAGTDFAAKTRTRQPTGTTDNATMLPLYMALIFVQKI